MTAELVDVDLRRLLTRAAAGDLDAFMAFYDATCTLAYHLERCRLSDAAAAGEATVQRYVTAWLLVREHARSGLSPRAWLLSLRVDDPRSAAAVSSRRRTAS